MRGFFQNPPVSFFIAGLIVYPVALINLSHEYICILSPFRPSREFI